MKATSSRNRSASHQISPRPRFQNTGSKSLQINNVLVPIDFSPSSLGAIEFALPLIKRFGAELHLAFVELDYPISGMVAVPLTVPEAEVTRRIRRDLKSVAKKYAISLSPKNIYVPTGRPFEKICQLARDIGIDLIVISTRGNTGLKHLVLGSTAERVVRYSPCPVLVVRGGDRKKKAGRNGKSPRLLDIRKILVPIDFSACSMQGLAYAKALAKKFGAKLVLLHAIHPQYYVTSDEYARYDFPLLMQQAEKAAREQMRDLVRKTDWEGIKIESSLQIDHVGDQICTRAKDDGVDMIVTSTHGTTGLKHILLGSTAEYVVRHAPCPVLVVPSHERPVITSSKTRK